MHLPDPEQQELAERDRVTVLNCDHGAIELTADVAKYMHGPALVETITCVTCPTLVSLTIASDPRDDMYARLPLGN
jgi:hypothetical protein